MSLDQKISNVQLPLIIPKDVIVQFLGNECFLVYNLFTRNNIICHTDLIQLCQVLLSENDFSKVVQENISKLFCIWDSEYFSHEDGLLADPTRIKWNEFMHKEPMQLDVAQVVSLLMNKNILLKDVKSYRERFLRKEGLLDKRHFGNFHQQLGAHLLLARRKDPSVWWVDQKFTEGFSGLQNNLYKAVQGNFLERFFKEKIQPGMKIVDIGCGTGFYSNMMAKFGAEVIGIDPNQAYINIAKKNKNTKTEFHVAPLGYKTCLEFLESACANAVFMSDSLLFYFVSYDAAPKPQLNLLLNEISRIIKLSGSFWSIEPNYTFWLSTWMGEEKFPFTVLTEYKERNFLVTPTISEFVQSILKGGFVVRDFREIYIDNPHNIEDQRAIDFASKFPLWQFFEFLPFSPQNI